VHNRSVVHAPSPMTLRWRWSRQPLFIGDTSSDQPFWCGIGWDGGTGTTWRSNADRDATAILLTQRAATSHTFASGPGLLGRRQCRHRGPSTSETTTLGTGASDPASGTRSTLPGNPVPDGYGPGRFGSESEPDPSRATMGAAGVGKPRRHNDQIQGSGGCGVSDVYAPGSRRRIPCHCLRRMEQLVA